MRGRPRALRDITPRIDGDVAYLPLPHGRETSVDVSDLPLVQDLAWSLTSTGYARARCAGRNVKLHFLLMPPRDGYEIDHVNRDKLDNRRSNLRYATHRQNIANSLRPPTKSGYRGVYRRWDGKWWASAGRQYAGCFATALEAALAYDSLARALFGDFAVLNFPEAT